MTEKQTDLLIVIAGIVMAVAGIFGGFSMVYASNSAAPIRISTPAPGITCATVMKTNSAAISCWKDVVVK